MTALDQLPPVLLTAELAQLGITKDQLYSWREEGLITPLGRGIFLQADAPGDPDLIEASIRAPQATLCLGSALAQHGLSDEIPTTTHLALPRGRRHPATSAPITWHTFDPETFELDRSTFETAPGFTLGIYGPARTVLDAFRLHHQEGKEIALEALRRWLRAERNQPRKLLKLLPHFPAAEKSVRAALEVLL